MLGSTFLLSVCDCNGVCDVKDFMRTQTNNKAREMIQQKKPIDPPFEITVIVYCDRRVTQAFFR